jgi:flavin reductase (DIM6/NTAB) family NADH-FMN oxidoreductase RutF
VDASVTTGGTAQDRRLVELDVSAPIWDAFFHVAPLVVIGTREADGSYDLAPKHLAAPMGWSNLFGFVCTPTHATYRNIVREGVYTVSYPRPDQIVVTSLAAAPRLDDDSKPALAALPMVPATTIEGVLLADAGVYLECELERVIDELDDNSLVIGRIVAARIDERARRDPDRDDADVLAAAPLLAYLPPALFAEIVEGNSFPFHRGWRR